MLKRFILEETGATAIEYALIAGFFGILITTAFTALSAEYKDLYAYIETVLVENTVSEDP